MLADFIITLQRRAASQTLSHPHAATTKVSECLDRHAEQDDGLGHSEAYFGSRDPARRRQHGHAEDDGGSEEDGVDLGLRNYAKGHRQSNAEYDGCKRGGTRPGHHKTGGGERQHDLAEDDGALETAGARPSRHNPGSQIQRESHCDQEASEDNKMFGRSRHGHGNLTRDPNEESHDDPGSRPSRALIRGGGSPEEQEGRFVPYTFRMLHPDHVEFLASFFKVRTSKVKEWCNENYMRMEKQNNYQNNIDLLLDTLTSQDREKYHKTIKKMESERKIRIIVPRGPSHARTAFDRGYYS